MNKNSLMLPLWRPASEVGDPEILPAELQDLVESGWQTGPAGSLLLVGCYGDGAGWRSDWQAEEIAQRELEVNDVSIFCDDLPKARDLFLRAAVARSRAFAGAALKAAWGLQAAEFLVAIVSVGVDDDYLTHGATVKFATRRGGFPESYEDLERFQYEAMAVIDSIRGD
ncbi:hypothetical protein [Streptomyces rhizosphaerihabitans]|uniref:hypothetical protein n=1 Tax=Streptomyces rhizosphaerihabitans TaxID=1266770 RepID=UPI0021BF3786|nr:hypothetical protein [Streptomyces rhizosphaerihabitans]MCT9010520.1 hypothetical protein [Streptomyces rhizosphaerihabitans]